ncbi:hypothetical protein Tco_0144335 [Tanacetum coccineum]
MKCRFRSSLIETVDSLHTFGGRWKNVECMCACFPDKGWGLNSCDGLDRILYNNAFTISVLRLPLLGVDGRKCPITYPAGMKLEISAHLQEIHPRDN